MMESDHDHHHIHSKGEFNEMFYLFGHVSTKFLGHVFCGASMLVLGTWWAANILLRLHRSRPHPTLNPCPRPYRCHAWFPGPWRSGVPLDGVLKLAVGFVEIVGEIQGTYYAGRFHWNDTTQHLALYSTLMISGVLDLLDHRRVAALPPGADFAGLALFYGTGAFLFHFHFHGESALNSRMHNFLLWLAVAAVLAVVRELCHGASVWASLVRVHVTLLFGTWLMQISFTLYSPVRPVVDGGGWSEDSNVALMVAVVYFCCHVQLTAMLLLVISAITYRQVRRGWAAQLANGGLQYVANKPRMVAVAAGTGGCCSGADEDEPSSDDMPLIRARDKCIVNGF